MLNNKNIERKDKKKLKVEESLPPTLLSVSVVAISEGDVHYLCAYRLNNRIVHNLTTTDVNAHKHCNGCVESHNRIEVKMVIVTLTRFCGV